MENCLQSLTGKGKERIFPTAPFFKKFLFGKAAKNRLQSLMGKEKERISRVALFIGKISFSEICEKLPLIPLNKRDCGI